jgi:hypothetical protein
MNWKELGEKRSRANSKYNRSIFLEGPSKTKNIFSQVNRCPGRDSNRSPPEEKSRGLPLVSTSRWGGGVRPSIICFIFEPTELISMKFFNGRVFTTICKVNLILANQVSRNSDDLRAGRPRNRYSIPGTRNDFFYSPQGADRV